MRVPYSDLKWLNEPDITENEFNNRFKQLQGLYDGRIGDKIRARERSARILREKQRIWHAQGRDSEGNLQWGEPLDDLPTLQANQDEVNTQLTSATDSEIQRHEYEVMQRGQEPEYEEPPSSVAFEPPSDNLASLDLN